MCERGRTYPDNGPCQIIVDFFHIDDFAIDEFLFLDHWLIGDAGHSGKSRIRLSIASTKGREVPALSVFVFFHQSDFLHLTDNGIVIGCTPSLLDFTYAQGRGFNGA